MPYTPLSSVAKPGRYAFTSSAWQKTVATSRRQRYPALVVSPSASSLFTMNSGYPPSLVDRPPRRGWGVPKKPGGGGRRRGHLDVFTQNPSLHLRGRQYDHGETFGGFGSSCPSGLAR